MHIVVNAIYYRVVLGAGRTPVGRALEQEHPSVKSYRSQIASRLYEDIAIKTMAEWSFCDDLSRVLSVSYFPSSD
jgi:hypothetical protein